MMIIGKESRTVLAVGKNLLLNLFEKRLFYLVLMSSNLERVGLESATLEAVKSEAWSLMSSTIR